MQISVIGKRVGRYQVVMDAGLLWLAQHLVIVVFVLLFQGFFHLYGLSSLQAGTNALNPFIWYDAGWYTHIALHGYDVPSTAAFPPFFPLLEALTIPLFGSPALAGLVIANLTGLVSCVLIRLVLDPILGEAKSQRALLLLLFCPMAMFFLSAYTESLFLLLSLGVFFCLRRQQYLWAGILTMLATLTRYNGIFLVIPIALCLAQERRWKDWHTLVPAPIALLTFYIGLGLKFGESPFSAVHDGWHHTLSWPWIGFSRTLAYTVTSPSLADTLNAIRDLTLMSVVIGLGIALVWTRIPLGFKLYTWATLLFILCLPVILPNGNDALLAQARYALPLFPLIIPLTSTQSRSTQALFFTLEILGLAYLMVSVAAGILIA